MSSLEYVWSKRGSYNKVGLGLVIGGLLGGFLWKPLWMILYVGLIIYAVWFVDYMVGIWRNKKEKINRGLMQ